MSLLSIAAGADVLGAMITPAVLISGCGTLSLATANRLGRVVDRIRNLSEVAETLVGPDSTAPFAHEKRVLIGRLLVVLTKRMHLLQNAVTLLYASIGVLIFTSLSLGTTLTLNFDHSIIPVLFGLLGATGMLAAVVHLVIETRLAVQSTIAEVDFTRHLVELATKSTLVSHNPPVLE
ncbi:DUF2721 domain-containing protein [soil metagenome]